MPESRSPLHRALNILPARASVLIGMNKRLVVGSVLAGILLFGCEQQPVAPSGGQPSNSPSPSPTATPAATSAATESPLTTPTPPSQATPESTSTPTPTPESTPTPTPASTPTATPESTPTATPAATPSTTPDGATPSPTPSPATAELDGRPTLSSQSANEYLQSYDTYISDFKSAYQAMKQGDMTKYQSVIQRALELQSKSDKLAGELNPEEEQRFANYLNKKANELAEFTNQNR
jgi:hypothetical protein